MPFYFPYAPTITPPPAKTSAYTFTAGDDGVPMQFNAAGGAINVTLPDPASVAGKTFIIVKIDATLNAINVNGLINGVPTTSLTDQYASLIVMAANGMYNIVAVTSN